MISESRLSCPGLYCNLLLVTYQDLLSLNPRNAVALAFKPPPSVIHMHTCVKRRNGASLKWTRINSLAHFTENQWARRAREWETDFQSDQSSRCDLWVWWSLEMRGGTVGLTTWKMPSALRASWSCSVFICFALWSLVRTHRLWKYYLVFCNLHFFFLNLTLVWCWCLFVF